MTCTGSLAHGGGLANTVVNIIHLPTHPFTRSPRLCQAQGGGLVTRDEAGVAPTPAPILCPGRTRQKEVHIQLWHVVITQRMPGTQILAPDAAHRRTCKCLQLSPMFLEVGSMQRPTLRGLGTKVSQNSGSEPMPLFYRGEN